MKNKHTPGPWINNGDLDFSGRTFICNTEAGVKHKAIAIIIGNNEADARLIAAAPDLYSACLLALVELGDDDNFDKFKDLFLTIKTAVDKAKGGAK